jgi:hypothetical protein
LHKTGAETFIGHEKRFHLSAEFLVGIAGAVQKRGALLWGELDHLMQ